VNRVLTFAIGIATAAIHGSVHGGAAENVGRVLLVVAIDPDRPLLSIDRAVHIEPCCVAVSLLGSVELLEEDHVGDDFGASIGREGVVRQSESANEAEVLGENVAGLRIGRIKESMGHYHRHDAARPEMHASLGDDVVVDFHARQVLAARVFVANVLRTEGRIADGKIKHAVTERRVLKTGRREDIGLGVDQRGHGTGYGVDFRSMPLRRGSHGGRLQSNEVAI